MAIARCLALSLCFILFYGCENNTPVVGPYPTTGFASWYIPRRTSSGERNPRDGYTCAMRKREFGRYYLACNPENNKCVVVRHNDFGPAFYLFREGRIIDLNKYAFSKIADLKKGIIPVRIGEVHFEDKEER